MVRLQRKKSHGIRYFGLDQVVLWIRKLFEVGFRSMHGMAVTGVVIPLSWDFRLTQSSLVAQRASKSSLAAQRATIGLLVQRIILLTPKNYFTNPEQLLYVH